MMFGPRSLFWLCFSMLLALDQASKELVRRTLDWGESVVVIPGFFSLTSVHNTGVAFGFLQGNNRLLALVALVLVGWGLYLARQLNWNSREVYLTAATLLAGALGNLLDRFRFGHVADFLDFYWGPHHWPAFNVADACICLSVAYIFIRQLGWNPRKSKS